KAKKVALAPRGKVFRDPIHGLIRIDQDDAFIIALVDCPEFQRLRRIRQLGVSSLTYPGADHTRFAHSLGVFNFAQRMLGVLLGRYRKNTNLTDLIESRRKVVLAAALLHDIGHGPFSHMIERASGTTSNHEKTTTELITPST